MVMTCMRFRSHIHAIGCGDETLAEEETAEHALAHQVGSKVRRAYRRRTALNKRTALMQQWCDYCASGIATERQRGAAQERVD